ncbi:hypothetical protein [Kitasatospora mediocidica]|uniref:hypothetical protein n=1 Tax=Kitasatospora mediocidica TaxID=58352 RepID=UPI00056B2B7B|nr:hypothetical protein [Kitasatospora mediocidica]
MALDEIVRQRAKERVRKRSEIKFWITAGVVGLFILSAAGSCIAHDHANRRHGGYTDDDNYRFCSRSAPQYC